MAKLALSYGHGANTYEDKHSKGVVVGGRAYEEHTFNAAVGVKVKDILQAHGVQVYAVQQAMGIDRPLSVRTAMANDWGADLYWSIHANAGPKDVEGFCAFYWQGSSKGLKAANLYKKHVQAAGFPLYAGGTYPSKRNDWTNFHELRETHMPAVLTENGFMTDPDDFRRIFLNDKDTHNRLAEAHAKAILEYFGIRYKAPTKDTVKPAPTTKQSTPVTFSLDSIAKKSDHTYRLAKIVDSANTATIVKLKSEGYQIIELPKN